MEGADTLQETGGNVNSISVSNSGEGIGCGSGGSAVSSAAAAAALLGPLSRGLQSLASRLLLLGGGRGQDEYTFSDLGVLEARLSGLRPFASSSGYGCGGGASDTFDGAAAAAIAAAAGAAGSVVAAGALVEIVRAWSSSSSDRNLQAAGLSDDLRPPGQRGGGDRQPVDVFLHRLQPPGRGRSWRLGARVTEAAMAVVTRAQAVVASPDTASQHSARDRTEIHRSALLMSLAMALHFFGYEFARSACLSQFTSGTTGFSSPGAFPLAMVCVSPLSLLLLLGYGTVLERSGPRTALRSTTLFCASVLCLAGGVGSLLDRDGGAGRGLLRLPGLGLLRPEKMLVWAAFVFQNSYAHLIYTQQWSFLGSVLTADEGARWFSSIAGLSSLSSTVGGTILGQIVGTVGLTGLLGVAGLSLVVSMMLADVAYDMSERNGFDPAEGMTKDKKRKDGTSTGTGEEAGLILKTRDMFRRVTILKALFFEVVSFQSLSTVLNVCFVTKLKDAVPDDAARAAWTGQFYAAINGISGLLQFVVLPLFMRSLDPAWTWRLMPLIPLFCTLFTSIQYDPSLYLVAFSFFAAKLMDYSLRNVLNEMVYVPLDFESRYLGKEVIGVFGNRFGKSGISLLLSGLTFAFGSFGIQELSRLTALASITWFSFAFRLGNLVPKKDEKKDR